MFKKLVTKIHKNQFNLDYDVWQKFTNKKNCSKVPLLEMDGQFFHYIFSTSLSIGMDKHLKNLPSPTSLFFITSAQFFEFFNFYFLWIE